MSFSILVEVGSRLMCIHVFLLYWSILRTKYNECIYEIQFQYDTDASHRYCNQDDGFRTRVCNLLEDFV